MEPDAIIIKGAREHNLRDVSVTLPRNRLICLSGVSGSGKSSFAFDTLFAEGQRRYIESLSAYARQFLGQLPKPDVDFISGLSPAVSIQQKKTGWNPRSTVGTITQIHDYLRVLFARLGQQHCPQCGRRISTQTRDQLTARILSLPEGSQVLILAPVIRGQKGEYRDLFDELLNDGYARARVDGQGVHLASPPPLDRNQRHDIEVVMDRLTIKPEQRQRLSEAVEAALKKGNGTLIVAPADQNVDLENRERGSRIAEPNQKSEVRNQKRDSRIRNPKSEIQDRKPEIAKGGLNQDLLLSSHYACPDCDLAFEPPSPQLFSFNSPSGMCLTCEGLGARFDFDPELLVPDPSRSFLEQAIEPLHAKPGRWRMHIFEGVARHIGFDLKTPWQKLSKTAREALLYGTGKEHITFEWRSRKGGYRHGGTFAGVIAELDEKYRSAQSPLVRAYYEKYMRSSVCKTCGGARLNAQARAVKLGGQSIQEVGAQAIADAAEFMAGLKFNALEQTIAEDVVREIRARLKFLIDVGLEYLALDRAAPTLSGGESQRIRLASQIGSGLTGVLYILDEPSIGLHPRDNQRLLESLRSLRDMGNTVVVVEHDEETMRAADWIVDFGPGPGVRGGEVVAEGDMDSIQSAPGSLTGKFLSGSEVIEVPKNRRPVSHSGIRAKTKSRNPTR